MFGRTIRSRLPQLGDVETAPVREEFADRDRISKEKGKIGMDSRRRAKWHKLKEGDRVLQRNIQKQNKLTTRYNAQPFRIVNCNGSAVSIQNEQTGDIFNRNVAHVVKIPSDEEDNVESSEDDEGGFKGFPDSSDDAEDDMRAEV